MLGRASRRSSAHARAIARNPVGWNPRMLAANASIVPRAVPAPTAGRHRHVRSQPADRRLRHLGVGGDGQTPGYTRPASWTTMATCTRLVALSLVSTRET